MSDAIGILEHAGCGHVARVPDLSRSGLIHGFSCRDMAPSAGGASDAVSEALAAHLGVSDLPRARLRQRHTARVHLALGGRARLGFRPVGDALVTGDPRVVLSIFTADCLPVLILDPQRNACAAVHAGWRGTAGGILSETIHTLGRKLQANPTRMRIVVGPGIRACCFEVGPDVEDAFHDAWPECEDWFRRGPRERRHLDLVAANRAQATAAGVPPSSFLDPGWCTRCRRDRFFSYRGDRGKTGRIVTLASLARPHEA